MKHRAIITTVLTLLNYSVQAQQPQTNQNVKDSSLYKLVQGIDATIKRRANDMKAPYFGTYAISTGKSYIIIDSLVNYNIKDFKKITVTLDADRILYGNSANYGIISLEKRIDTTSRGVTCK